MKQPLEISTQRVEAFSDGVIAIAITVMVFDLKWDHMLTAETVRAELWMLMPKGLSYILSFVVLAIMWISHHQLFHQIRNTDRKLLWLNMHLLFWMSAVPFATHMMGQNPRLWQSCSVYGTVFFMTALSFTWLRLYAYRSGLLHANIHPNAFLRVRNKNKWALMGYAAAAFLAPLSVYLSYALFALVPAMYIVPEKITHVSEQ